MDASIPRGLHGFRISTTTGSAAEFHRRTPEDGVGHEVWLHLPERPALVLGSTQPDELVHREKARSEGIEVCRRRSGGGLVYLDPTNDCWIDVIIPVGSPLWSDDVGHAFHWVGELWAQVLDRELSSAGPVDTHDPNGRDGPLDRTPRVEVHRSGDGRSGRLWCFGALGHGEVSVVGSKVVGLSQRRTRTWARLQSLAIGPWNGAVMGRFVDRQVAATVLGGAPADVPDPALLAAGLPPRFTPFDPTRLANRFVAALLE